MSHHQHHYWGVLGPPLPRAHRPLPSKRTPTRSKCKRLRTKRERDAAKFGPKAALGGSRGPPRWLQPPPWRGLALGSPLGPPKPVVITQNRLCHRGLFNHEVKSLDVRRLLTPGPGGDGPPAPQIEEGEVGGVPAEALRELVAGLASLLGGFGVFGGRELVSERRRSLVAALRRHRRGPLDLGVFLAHRTPAQASGQGSPRKELPPRAPSPIFGALREREKPFSWSSAEDEEDETPGGLPQPWGAPGALLSPPPPFWGSPQPPQEEEEGGDEGWPPIAPPAFSPPEGPPQSGAPRAPRPLRAPNMWRTETPWDPPGPPRSPCDAPRPLWDSPPRNPPRPLWDPPDPARAAPQPPRASRAPQIWSLEPRRDPPDPLRPPWDPPNPSGPPWDPRPWSPELPGAVLDAPRTPQLWNPEPPRAPWEPPRLPWDPPAAPRPLWGSPNPPRPPPDPPRSSWSPAPPWDAPRDPRPWSPEPPGAPQHTEPSRCCCRRLCRYMAQRHPLLHDPPCQHSARRDPSYGHPFHRAPLCRDMPCRDVPRCCHQPPKRRRRQWGGVGGRPWGSPPCSPLLPGGCGCPCGGACCGGTSS